MLPSGLRQLIIGQEGLRKSAEQRIQEPQRQSAGVTGRWGHLDPTRGRLLSSSSDSEEGDVKHPTPKRRMLAPLANALGFACFRLFVSSIYSHTNTVNNFNTRNPQCR